MTGRLLHYSTSGRIVSRPNRTALSATLSRAVVSPDSGPWLLTRMSVAASIVLGIASMKRWLSLGNAEGLFVEFFLEQLGTSFDRSHHLFLQQ